MRRKSKGSLTAFACICSAALIVLGLVSASIVEYKCLETVAQSTVYTALDAGLATRQKELLRDYGLYAVQMQAVQSEVGRVTNTVFAQNGGYAAENVSATVTPLDDFVSSSQLETQIATLMSYVPTDGSEQGAELINDQSLEWMAQADGVHWLWENKKPQYIGKLLTVIQLELNAMEESSGTLQALCDNTSDGATAAQAYMQRVAYVQSLMAMIEEVEPYFEELLATDYEQTVDEWFVINDYFGEIYSEYYRQVGTLAAQQQECYNAYLEAVQADDPSQTQHAARLAALAQKYPKLLDLQENEEAPLDPNGDEVDALLAQGAQLFDTQPISFAYEPIEPAWENDLFVSFDTWSEELFFGVDTWQEGWYAVDVMDRDYHLQDTYLDEAERIIRSLPMVHCSRTNGDVERYILRWCTHLQSKEESFEASAMPHSEVEYILAGNADAAVNLRTVFTRIWAMRFCENYAVMAMDYPSETAGPRGSKYLYCEMYDLVAQNFRRALVESYLETYRMVIYGDKVALNKTHDNMILSSTNSLAKSISPDTLTIVCAEGEVTVGYEDYLGWFLAATDSETKLMRLATVINENLALRTNGEAPDIRTLYASFEVTLCCDAARFANLAVMPGEDKKVLCPQKVCVSRHGGYTA